jgi:hypothetical protein
MAATIWLDFTIEKRGCLILASKTESMSKLNTQLPKISPAAKSGALTKTTELIPVINSGNEVTDAIKISPTHALPIPVRSAILSP